MTRGIQAPLAPSKPHRAIPPSLSQQKEPSPPGKALAPFTSYLARPAHLQIFVTYSFQSTQSCPTPSTSS